ncbi:hypothetical protein ACUXCC_003681 [Cytobacillus horneckiae]|uniref:hypothetical protein n=1 Tax=Cytobacillus horneckiae TaxID=549687 RepID=UPI0019D2BD03|nr:hypothetical protein [Cytobacillus horneckiae]MBN6888719.1 hypothetical protein [Cytobacillus horneckiae]MCM3180626.1 hypothetical protein [Cytobacillus horneckiae]
MFWLWGVVLLIFVSLLLFGYLLDKKTDRYKSINDKKTKEGQEDVKDKTQKHNPPNINHTDHW